MGTSHGMMVSVTTTWDTMQVDFHLRTAAASQGTAHVRAWRGLMLRAHRDSTILAAAAGINDSLSLEG